MPKRVFEPISPEAAKKRMEKATRFGRSVITQSLETAKASVSQKAVIESQEKLLAMERKKLEAQIAELDPSKGKSAGTLRKLKKLHEINLHKGEILEICRQWADRQPHTSEVAAFLALTKGLKRSDLAQQANAMRSVQRTKTSVPFSGFAGEFGKMLRPVKGAPEGLLLLAYEMLAEGKAITTADLIERAGLKRNPSTSAVANTALGVLDLMGEAHKLPKDRSKHVVYVGKDLSRDRLTIPNWNSGFNILNHLRARELTVNELSKIMRSPHQNIWETVSVLMDSGLIIEPAELTTQKTKLKLTPFAATAIDKTIRQGHLDESLRRALLGSFSLKLNKIERQNYQRVISQIDEYFRAVKYDASSGKPAPLMPADVKFITGIWHQFSPRTRQRLLDEMKRQNPAHAKFFEAELEKGKIEYDDIARFLKHADALNADLHRYGLEKTPSIFNATEFFSKRSPFRRGMVYSDYLEKIGLGRHVKRFPQTPKVP